MSCQYGRCVPFFTLYFVIWYTIIHRKEDEDHESKNCSLSSAPPHMLWLCIISVSN
jgi:hypothetical protein